MTGQTAGATPGAGGVWAQHHQQLWEIAFVCSCTIGALLVPVAEGHRARQGVNDSWVFLTAR